MHERTSANVSKHLEVLYDSYYTSDAFLLKKRDLSAAASAEKIRQLFGSSLGSVVDVGAGNGNVAQALSDRGMYQTLNAVEISQSGIQAILQRNLPGLSEAKTFDGYGTGYADRQFDVALAIHVVEHVEHERLFLRELARIAREVYVEVPLEGGIRGRTNLAYGHINYYTSPYFLTLLETSGLRPMGFDVFAPSRELEVHIGGRFKGMLKFTGRSALRKLVGPMLAPSFLAYHMGVRCESM